MEFKQNDLIQELSTNFIEYAAAVNMDRAIPDATSGLKPVVRRIIYGAYATGRTSNKPHVKCANIVGNIMGVYHPHGDSSIYGALVRIAQPWVMRYPLIDFHGNMGNIGGDGPASYRYTEARLAKLSEDGLLAGIKKKNVDFQPNYDETDEEPITLPAIFPNLLCNPNTGIGVAMACNWASHNLNEVADAIKMYLAGEEPTLPGPDFPTGGLIINKNDIPKIMKTGKGTVKIRGKYNIEKDRNIVFYEIPYGVSTEALLTDIGKLCDEKVIEGIANLRDESNKKGMRIVIECEKDANIDGVIKLLFAKSDLQSSFSYNQVALVNKVPTELNLKDCIENYVQHNENCIKREAEFDKKKAEDRLHIVDGLLKALEDIDNIIALIKKSASAAAAQVKLVETYSFSEIQAKAIVDMKLGKLAGLEKIELQKEQAELIADIEGYNLLINNREKRIEELLTRLDAIVKKYGDARRTELAQIEVSKDEKEIEEVVPEDCVVMISQNGDIKRIPASAFKVQKRNGKGVKTADDALLEVISTNTIDTLMAFSNKGKMYRLIVDQIPVGTNASKGVRIGTLINTEPDEKIIAITSLYRKSNAEYVIFITKNGLIKKTKLEEYMATKKKTGIAAISLKEGDSLANVTFANEEEFLIITKQGMIIRFETAGINPIGRVTAGVRSIKLNEGDEVLIGLPIHKETDTLAVFYENGLGKKTELSEFPVQGRGGKGLKLGSNIVVGASLICDDDNILIVGKPNSICISAKDIPLLSRTANGNILIKGSQISTAIKI
jgi:DNA gyrase subunit A